MSSTTEVASALIMVHHVRQFEEAARLFNLALAISRQRQSTDGLDTTPASTA
jgi:hypothetical protein